MSILDLLKEKIIICDGAMGTMIQKSGVDAGKIPELLCFTHPEVISDIYRNYFEAGSDFVSTNTFGASRDKLAGCGYGQEEVIQKAVELAREQALLAERKARESGNPSPKFVALDVAPLGKLMEPMGDLTFEEAYEQFAQQIRAGAGAGADFVLLETFTDIYELKAAILAAKESCHLPVFCSVSFQEDGRMLMGTDPATMVNIVQDLGVDALGVNCSLGPVQMVPIVKEILNCSKLPVLVQPNAGLPTVKDGETVYDVDIAQFTKVMVELAEDGISIAGGCCGTSPEYIAGMSRALSNRKPNRPPLPKPAFAVSSSTRTVVLDDRIRIIGERINPTGKKLLKEALRMGDLTYVEDEAIRQVEAGADILDINVGLPEIDELEMMVSAVKAVSQVVDVPLQIDSADPLVLEKAVRIYNGKPIINSVNGKMEVMEKVFPIVQKYGACVIALTLDEKGLPENADERMAIAERIIKKAAEYGIGPERILVDCLTLTVSAQQNAGRDTLEAIRRVKAEYGVKTTLGASNVSFGLPQRKLLNRTFLAMALEAGLDAPITDPLVADYTDTICAFEALSGKDRESEDYISCYGGDGGSGGAAVPRRQEGTEKSGISAGTSSADKSDKAGPAKSTKQEETAKLAEGLSLEEIVIKGYADRAGEAAEKLLKEMKPLAIVEEKIIPALEIVGKDYERGRSFLPQLIKSADTVSSAFEVLKTVMENSGESISYGKVILATVEGDIHDIGKNIVRVILENYGYEVLDLGKDVPVETIVRTAREENIKLVGLSALMTTTVVNMEKTIRALKEAGIGCRTAVGGAVLTREYADQIGADYYCKDAMDTVKAANGIFR